MATEFNDNINLNVNAITQKALRDLGVVRRELKDIISLADTTSASAASARTGGTTNNVRQLQQNARATRQSAQATDQATKQTSRLNKELVRLRDRLGDTAERFFLYSLASRAILGVGRAFINVTSEAIKFDRELVRVAQLTRTTIADARLLGRVIEEQAVAFGTSADILLQGAQIFAQAGLSLEQTRNLIEQLAPTTLTATFGAFNKTANNTLAILEQFNLSVGQAGRIADSFNAVAKETNVSVEELFDAARRAGAGFAAFSGALAQPTGAEANIRSLQEFQAVIAATINITRESAETIGTGLRTIIPRLQRRDTIDTLREFGIVLTEGQGAAERFVGPFEAIRRISERLETIDPQSTTFSAILEQIGGLRQINRTTALVTGFSEALRLNEVALNSQGSVQEDVALATTNLQVRIDQLQQSFFNLARDIIQSDSFQNIASAFVAGAEAAVELTRALQPLLPLLSAVATIGSIRLIGAVAQAARSPFNEGGLSQGVNVSLTRGELVFGPNAVRKYGLGTLDRINRQAFNSGGIANLNRDVGIVNMGSSANVDSVDTSIPSGSFVLNRAASARVLSGNTPIKLNRGGRVGFQGGGSVNDVAVINNLAQTNVELFQAAQQAAQAFERAGLTAEEALNRVVTTILRSEGSQDAATNLSRGGINKEVRNRDLERQLSRERAAIQKRETSAANLRGGGGSASSLDIPTDLAVTVEQKVENELRGGGVSSGSLNIPITNATRRREEDTRRLQASQENRNENLQAAREGLARRRERARESRRDKETRGELRGGGVSSGSLNIRNIPLERQQSQDRAAREKRELKEANRRGGGGTTPSSLGIPISTAARRRGEAQDLAEIQARVAREQRARNLPIAPGFIERLPESPEFARQDQIRQELTLQPEDPTPRPRSNRDTASLLQREERRLDKEEAIVRRRESLSVTNPEIADVLNQDTIEGGVKAAFENRQREISRRGQRDTTGLDSPANNVFGGRRAAARIRRQQLNASQDALSGGRVARSNAAITNFLAPLTSRVRDAGQTIGDFTRNIAQSDRVRAASIQTQRAARRARRIGNTELFDSRGLASSIRDGVQRQARIASIQGGRLINRGQRLAGRFAQSNVGQRLLPDAQVRNIGNNIGNAVQGALANRQFLGAGAATAGGFLLAGQGDQVLGRENAQVAGGLLTGAGTGLALAGITGAIGGAFLGIEQGIRNVQDEASRTELTELAALISEIGDAGFQATGSFRNISDSLREARESAANDLFGVSRDAANQRSRSGFLVDSAIGNTTGGSAFRLNEQDRASFSRASLSRQFIATTQDIFRTDRGDARRRVAEDQRTQTNTAIRDAIRPQIDTLNSQLAATLTSGVRQSALEDPTALRRAAGVDDDFAIIDRFEDTIESTLGNLTGADLELVATFNGLTTAADGSRILFNQLQDGLENIIPQLRQQLLVDAVNSQLAAFRDRIRESQAAIGDFSFNLGQTRDRFGNVGTGNIRAPELRTDFDNLRGRNPADLAQATNNLGAVIGRESAQEVGALLNDRAAIQNNFLDFARQQAPDSQVEDVVRNFAKAFDINAPGIKAELDEFAAGLRDTSLSLAFADGSIGEIAEKFANFDRFGLAAETTSQGSQASNERASFLASAFIQLNTATVQNIQGRNELDQRRFTQRQESRAARNRTNVSSSIPGTSDASDLAQFQFRNGNRALLNGLAQPTDNRQIAREIQQRRDAIDSGTLSIDAQAQANQEIQRLTQALENNTQQTLGLAAVNQELASIQGARQGSRSFLERAAFGGQREAVAITRELANFRLLTSGRGNAVRPENREAAVRTAREFAATLNADDLASGRFDSVFGGQVRSQADLENRIFSSLGDIVERLAGNKFSRDAVRDVTTPNALQGKGNAAEIDALNRREKLQRNENDARRLQLQLQSDLIDRQREVVETLTNAQIRIAPIQVVGSIGLNTETEERLVRNITESVVSLIPPPPRVV